MGRLRKRSILSNIRDMKCMGESRVCTLKKALYGLKQGPCTRYARIDEYLLGLGFTKSEENSNLYYVLVEGESLILVLYVDNIFFTRLEKFIWMCKVDLASEFKMKVIGLMYTFLDWRCSNIQERFSLGKEIMQLITYQDLGWRIAHMSTSMITNLKKPSTFKGELVDPP